MRESWWSREKEVELGGISGSCLAKERGFRGSPGRTPPRRCVAEWREGGIASGAPLVLHVCSKLFRGGKPAREWAMVINECKSEYVHPELLCRCIRSL